MAIKNKEGKIERKSGTISFPQKEKETFLDKIRKVNTPFVRKLLRFFRKNEAIAKKLPIASIEAGSGEIFFVVKEEATLLLEGSKIESGDKVKFSTLSENKGRQRFAFDVKLTIKMNAGGKNAEK